MARFQIRGFIITKLFIKINSFFYYLIFLNNMYNIYIEFGRFFDIYIQKLLYI